jgi:hypothetical protein
VPDEATNANTAAEWRELGFYYDIDHSQKCWRLVGSKSGLTGFADSIQRYAADPRNERLSEHEHFGPYFYLEIQTASEPGMDGHSIHGSLLDLGRLADLIRLKVGEACRCRAGCVPASLLRPSSFPPACPQWAKHTYAGSGVRDAVRAPRLSSHP